MTLHWYTVHSKPNQELLLWNQLQQREVSYFPPKAQAGEPQGAAWCPTSAICLSAWT